MRTDEIISLLDNKLPEARIEADDISEKMPEWLRRAEITSRIGYPLSKSLVAIDLDGWEWEASEFEEVGEEAKREGFEALAWYRPYHAVPHDQWGIYIREKGVLYLVNFLLRNADTHLSPSTLSQDAFSVLYRHELFHFLTEIAATFIELMLRQPKYKGYLLNRIDKQSLRPVLVLDRLANRNILTGRVAGCVANLSAMELEEALANAHVLRVRLRRGLRKAIGSFMKTLPRGYADFDAFSSGHDFAYNKRLLGMVISWPANTANFLELLFNVEPETCLEEVPLFIVRDYFGRRGSLQLVVARYGARLEVHPGDHPPPHIHVRILAHSPREQRYSYPDLKPILGSEPLSGKDEQRVKRVIQGDPRFARELAKIRGGSSG